MTTKQVTWKEAILEVLKRADEPLGCNAITSQIKERNSRTVRGATPNRTVSSELGNLINENKVRRTARGLYALPEVAEHDENELRQEEKTAREKFEDPQTLTVKAYGLYWDRKEVIWKKNELWGRQISTDKLVNFADQVGIYLLHNWNEIVYVGQARSHRGNSGLYNRLKEHHSGNKIKIDRWNSFSWFGFRSVNDENGSLQKEPSAGNLHDVIDVLETIFIEAQMPRLNLQSGPGSDPLRNGGLYIQASVQDVNRGIS